MPMIIVLTTISTGGQAEVLAEKIIQAKLAACVQVLPQMTSVYIWEGKMQHEPEHLLLIKTLAGRYDELEAFIRENHTYAVPEIVAVRSEQLSDAYQAWLGSVLEGE